MVTGVLVDANVLFSRTLRDWLFLLRNETGGGMFTVWATEDIMAETIYRYRRQHPTASGGLIASLHDRICEQLDDRIRDYEINGAFPGADENDQHVHAAAGAAGAGILLTCDTGFSALSEVERDALPYDVFTPDEFFCLISDSQPSAVHEVTRCQVRYWLDRDGEVDLARRLVEAQCPRFAHTVAACINSLG